MEVYLTGIGAYLPPSYVSNATFSSIAGLDADWIQRRAGIEGRYLARPGLGTEEMATMAGAEALRHAGVAPADVGHAIVVSSFHEPFPRSTAKGVCQRLGLTTAHPLDICTPLTGFIDALRYAVASVASTGRPALVIGAEGFSDATRFRDRRTCYLLSDGAGALLLAPARGFARLGELAQGAIDAPSSDPADPDPVVPVGQAPYLLEALRRAAATAVDSRSVARTVHVLTQQVDPTALAGTLPEVARVFSPFGASGQLLGASLPLALHRLFQGGELVAGDRCLLFCADRRGWTSCTIDVISVPQARPADTSGHERAGAGTEGSRVVAVTTRPDLDRALTSEAARPDALAASLVLVAVDLRAQPGLSPGLQEKASQEALGILSSHTRATDTIVRFRDTTFFLLLRHIDRADAARLADRVTALIEMLDLAGEITYTARVSILPLEAGLSPEAFAGRAAATVLGA